MFLVNILGTLSNKMKNFLRTKIRKLEKPLIRSGISYDQIIKLINNLASSEVIVEDFFKSTYKKITKRKRDIIYIDYLKFKKFKQ